LRNDIATDNGQREQQRSAPRTGAPTEPSGLVVNNRS